MRDALRLVLRNVWWIAASTLLVVSSTAYYVWRTPAIYEGRATIHVAQESAGQVDLEFLSSVLASEDVETEMALLRARSVAEAAVDSLSLQVQVLEPRGVPRDELFSSITSAQTTQLEVYTFERDGNRYRILDSRDREVGMVARGEPIVFNATRLVISEEDLRGREDPSRAFPDRIVLSIVPYYEAVDRLSRSLAVGRLYRDASVISVAFQGTDPNLVRDVPNEVSEVYIEHRRRAKKTEAVSTVAFLEEQIATYQVELSDAEERLLAFQQGEQVVNLQAEGAEQVRRLVEAQADRDELQAELTSLQELLNQIDRAVPGEDFEGTNPFRRLAGFPTFLQNQAVTDLMSELNRIETEQADMATRRTANHPDMVAFQRSIRQLEDQLYQLAVNYRNSLNNRIASALERLDAFGGQLERIPEKALQEARLQRQQTVLEEVYSLLQTRLKEAEIAQAVVPGDVRIVDRAIRPLRPVRPRKVRSLVLALLFGLVAGVGVSVAREQLDERLHSREDLARVTQQPVLAIIPRIRASSNGKRPSRASRGLRDRLVTQHDASNPVSEAYRSLRTNITFLDLDQPRRVMVLTSPGPSEGKSTSAANLAITLGQQGTGVVLVDADLRKGILHRVFQESPAPGLTDVLMGSAHVHDAVRTIELDEGRSIDLLPAGTLPPNPAELLGSRKMRELVAQLRDRYEFVLFDTPPLNLVTDAAVLGTEADSVVLVARAGSTVRGAIRYALDQLVAVKAPIAGVIFNDVDYSGRHKYYGADTGYGYSDRYYRESERSRT